MEVRCEVLCEQNPFFNEMFNKDTVFIYYIKCADLDNTKITVMDQTRSDLMNLRSNVIEFFSNETLATKNRY